MLIFWFMCIHHVGFRRLVLTVGRDDCSGGSDPGWWILFSLGVRAPVNMGSKLFDLVFKMKNFGVGSKFTRSTYNKYPGACRLAAHMPASAAYLASSFHRHILDYYAHQTVAEGGWVSGVVLVLVLVLCSCSCSCCGRELG